MKAKLAMELFRAALPSVVMVLLIPLVTNDYELTAIYVTVIAVSAVWYTRLDFAFLIFGFCALFCGEYLFISTGVETFVRNSLFGIMPLWLPLLWAYVFVAIERSVKLFERYLS